MTQTTHNITLETLHDRVEALQKEGYRLVQIHCTKLQKMEVNYSFDKDLEFVNLRMEVTDDTEIQSVSDIYWCALLYENEMHDLFGLNIKDMAIDFKGNLYQTSIKTPFNCGQEEK